MLPPERIESGVGTGAPSGPPPKPRKSARAIAWARRGRTIAQNWRTYRRSKIGIAGLAVLGFFVAIAVLAPAISSRSGLDEAYAADHHQPQTLPPSFLPLNTHQRANLESQGVNPRSIGTWQYPFGTDASGRSVLTLTIWGSRVSLIVGLFATIFTMLIGAVIGIASGYFGGRIDTLLNGVTNWFLVIPWIALAIVLASILGPSLINIIVVIALTSWAANARVIRSQALSVRNRSYVERARALGASNWHIVTRHILPNVFPIIFANTTLTVALSILAETTLSLLGLGSPTNTSWGTVLEDAFRNGASTLGAWWWLLAPGLGITLVVLSFAMCGYALDEILDPRLRER